MTAGTLPHLRGSLSSAMAITVATTQAAPPMSPRIMSMLGEGLMEIPPVSKVTPVCGGGEGRMEEGGGGRRREDGGRRREDGGREGEREETGKKMGGSREGRERERMDRGKREGGEGESGERERERGIEEGKR